MDQIRKAARTILRKFLGLKINESVLIAVEDSLWDIGETFWQNAKKYSRHPILNVFTSNGSNGHSIPETLSHSLPVANAVIFLTTQQINQDLFAEARKKGARFFVIDRLSRELFSHLLEADYKNILYKSRRLADIFSIGRKLQLTSPYGTEASFVISRNKGIVETIFPQQPGELTLLPAGEACIHPTKHSIQGQIVLNGVAGGNKLFRNPVTLHVTENQIKQIKGKQEAEELRKTIRKFGKEGRKINELGIGTNGKARLGISAQQDEKVLGTVHLAFGQNHVTKVRRKVSQMVKGIILEPTVSIDGKLIIKDGHVLV